jgi:hypothetical protein
MLAIHEGEPNHGLLIPSLLFNNHNQQSLKKMIDS